MATVGQRAALVAACFSLLALGACGGKKYTCTIFVRLGNSQIPVKQVEVSSRKECTRLADEYRLP